MGDRTAGGGLCPWAGTQDPLPEVWLLFPKGWHPVSAVNLGLTETSLSVSLPAGPPSPISALHYQRVGYSLAKHFLIVIKNV